MGMQKHPIPFGSRDQLFPTDFRSVNTGQSNLFTCCSHARVAVVARGDHNGCFYSKEHH